MSDTKHTPGPILPLYYVRHPDGSYSVAHPQPTPEQIAQQDETFALCDGVHAGSACADPYCYLPRANAHGELVTAARRASELIRADGMHGCADELDAAIAKVIAA